MLAEADINQTIIKKIVGHSCAMTLTEKVYTHFDVKELVDAINRIQETNGAIRKSLRDFAHVALARYICHRIYVSELQVLPSNIHQQMHRL